MDGHYLSSFHKCLRFHSRVESYAHAADKKSGKSSHGAIDSIFGRETKLKREEGERTFGALDGELDSIQILICFESQRAENT